MNIIQLSPIETLIAKPPKRRTVIEQIIVNAYRMGDKNAEKAATEWLHAPRRYVQPLAPDCERRSGRRAEER